MKNIAKLILISVLSACLSSCAPKVEVVSFPPIKFSEDSLYNFKVNRIEFINNYRQKIARPNVEHLMPYNLGEVLREWTNTKVHAVGGTDVLKVVVRDASMVEIPLAKQQDFQSKFKDQQSEKYHAKLEVAFELFGKDPLFPKSEAKVSIYVTETLPESASLNDREKLYYNIERSLMKAFEDEADRVIRSSFSPILTYY